MRPPAPGGVRHRGWSPAVRAALAELLAGPPGVALFDCDHTLLSGDISETLLADDEREGSVPLVAPYLEHVARDKLGAYVELVHTLVAGRTEAEVRDRGERTLARHPEIGPRPAMRELVWALQRGGWDVWVVSASPEVLVQAAVASFGLHPHRVIGMRSAVGADGRFVAELVGPPTWREGKVAAVAAEVVGPLRFAAGDSEGDLPMMAACPSSLLVDCGSDVARERARTAGAWIQPAAPLSEPA